MPTPNEEAPTMPPHRSTDDPVLSAKIVREVPLWGLLMVCASIAAFTISQYIAVGKLTDKVQDLSTSNTALVSKVDSVVKDLADRKAEVGLLTFRLDQVERRVTAVEVRK